MLSHGIVQSPSIELWHNLYKEIMWIRQLLMKVGIETSVSAKFWCDNQGTEKSIISADISDISRY